MSITDDIKANSTWQSNFPWFEILNVDEFVALKRALLPGYFEISNGPKSKTFSVGI